MLATSSNQGMNGQGQDINSLVNYLQQTYTASNNDQRKIAENHVLALEKQNGYAASLINIIGQQTVDVHVRCAAAARLKNFVKAYWHEIATSTTHITDTERELIKTNIVESMLVSQKEIQRYLSDTIPFIAKFDFPDNWTQLLPYLCQKLQSGDMTVIYGVLQTARSLFERYSFEFRSDSLWGEIKYVLDNFAEPFTRVSQQIMTALDQSQDEASKRLYLSLLNEVMRIYYSLNYQDMPEFFEDNMQVWMDMHAALLKYNNPALNSKDDSPGPLENVKSQVCENIALYASKYDDSDSPFKALLPVFVQHVWDLLISTDLRLCNDYLVSKALGFLSSVATKPATSKIFADENTLNTICKEVVIPNMKLRECDVQMFEIDCEEYITRDIEGSDVDTRRRAATDLVKALRENFQNEVTNIFSAYVGEMLQNYASAPQNFHQKDTAIYLVISLAVTSTVQRFGTTKVNPFVNIPDFFGSQIIGELQKPNMEENLILRADAIKFIITFRNQLDKQTLVQLLPILQQHLGSSSYVVHSYAANAVDKILSTRLITDATQGERSLDNVSQADVAPHVEGLLIMLFQLLDSRDSSENEYVMQAVMKLIVVAETGALPYVEIIIDKLCAKLVSIAKNPGRPNFNHNLFETLSAAIKFTCANQATVAAFENKLWPTFSWVLEQEIAEFIPYVLQLIGQLLDLNPDTPERYVVLFPKFLQPSVWETIGNVPALARLLKSYLMKNGNSLCQDAPTFQYILGVFQKLISSKVNDNLGFEILQTIIEFVSRDIWMSVMVDIFKAIFTRLSRAKTSKFVRCSVVFISFLISKTSPDAVIATVDSVQPSLFAMVLESLFFKELQYISSPVERKTCVVGIVKLLTECPKMLNEPYSSKWAPLLFHLVSLLEVSPRDGKDEDLRDDHTGQYQVSFIKLQHSGGFEERDLFPQIAQPAQHVSGALQQWSQSHPGVIQNSINVLEVAQKVHLMDYLKRIGFPM